MGQEKEGLKARETLIGPAASQYVRVLAFEESAY